MDFQTPIADLFIGRLQSLGLSSGEFIVNLLVALFLVVMGVFLGKIVKFGLRRLVEKVKVDPTIKQSFVNLSLNIIKWSIYILFIDLALIQLGIPAITSWLITILGVIPALTGALIIIGAGFGLAIYLKKVIEKSRIEGWQMLSEIFFYFVLYSFLIIAFKTISIPLQDKDFVNKAILIFLIISGAIVVVNRFKSEK